MPVTITLPELAADLRLGDGSADPAAPIDGMLQRHLDTATAIVGVYLPSDTPNSILNTSVIRIAGYLYDAPQAASGMRFAHIIVNSGAADLMRLFRPIDIYLDGAAATATPATPETPTEDDMPQTLMNVGHFDVPASAGPAANIAATFTDGRFRAQVQNQSPALVRYYYGTTAPTDINDYFIVGDGYGVFDFVGGEPCWVIGRVISVPVTVALVS